MRQDLPNVMLESNATKNTKKKHHPNAVADINKLVKLNKETSDQAKEEAKLHCITMINKWIEHAGQC